MCQLYCEHLEQSVEGLNYTSRLPEVKVDSLKKKSVKLGPLPVGKDKTIVLDLDETLMHCCLDQQGHYDQLIAVHQERGAPMLTAAITFRPHVHTFLQTLAQHFELGIFTASQQPYATQVINALDPHRLYIHFALFRDNCLTTENGLHIKDLRILLDRDLDKVIMVDNNAFVFGLNIENGVPIIPFYDCQEDDELLQLEAYLLSLKHIDVKTANHHAFYLATYIQHSSLSHIITNLYQVTN